MATRKFRWSADDGATWTVVSSELPYNIASVGSLDSVIVEPIGSPATIEGGIIVPITRQLSVRSDGTSTLTTQQTWLGAPFDQLILFAERNNGFNDWADNLSVLAGEIAKFPTQPKDWAIPLCTGAVGEGIADTIAGTHDATIRAMAESILAAAPATGLIHVRPGWEGNLLVAYPWGWSNVSRQQYIDAFRRVADIFRSVSERFAIHFCVSWRRDSGVDFRELWPGSAYVDVVSVDAYCLEGTRVDLGLTPAEHSAYMFSAPYGIDMIRDYAVLQGKPLAINEWGVNYDNPAYITAMAAFVRSNDVVFHGYWDQNNGDFTCRLSADERPNSAMAFVREFGPFWITSAVLSAAPNAALSAPVLATKQISSVAIVSGTAGVSGTSVTASAEASGTRRVTVRASDERGLTSERSIALTWQDGAFWTPESFGASLVDWIRADDQARLSRHNGAVKAIASATGSTRLATAPSAGQRPAFTTRSGFPMLSFDGGDALVQTVMTSVPAAQAAITRAVMLYTATGVGNFTYFASDADAVGVGRGLGHNAGNLRVGITSAIAGDSISNSDRSVVVSFGAGGTAAVRASVDGDLTPSTGNVTIASTTYTKRVYGATGTSIDAVGSYFLGGLYEAFDVSGVLTSGQEELAHGYLAWSYGREASLPAGHPYAANPPMVA